MDKPRKWTFTGEILDNIPQSLKDNVKSVYAPNTTRVTLVGYLKLESIETPKATEVTLVDCHALKSVKAPKAQVYLSACHKLKSVKALEAKTVQMITCPEVESVEAPKAKRIDLDDNQHLQGIIIQQLKNPQKLRYFKVNRFTANIKDITQDIKNADMELNGSERVSALRGGIVCKMRPGKNVSENEPSKVMKEVKSSQGVMSTIGSFLNPNTIDSLSKVNKKAHDGSLSETCTSNLQAIKNDKKERIAQKTHAYNAASETVENILNGVFSR